MKNNLKFKKYVTVFIVSIMITAGFTQGVYADALVDNIRVSGAIQSNFKYEKTIDLTNGDRSHIPDADFSFTLEKLKDGYMLGETYKNKDGKDVFTIKKGTLPDGNDQIPFSTVKFRSTDKYDEELTKLLDNYASAEKILNYIIKYSWGEMRSSNNIQTVIAREPNEEEKEAFRAGYGNGWAEDTVAWR